MLFFIRYAFKSQFGGRKESALEAADILNKRYLREYLERGDLSQPEVITGSTLRYRGNMQGTRIELKFFTSPLRFLTHEGDLRAIEVLLDAKLAQIRVWLPKDAAVQSISPNPRETA